VPSPRINLVVLFGGQSAEHDVSRVTAAHVLRAVDPNRYSVTPIAISRTGEWLLADSASAALRAGSTPDALTVEGAVTSLAPVLERATTADPGAITVVLPLLHGPMGEDGTVQGALELANIPYVGCGVLASALSMDKAATKEVLAYHGIPQARWRSLRGHQITSETADELVGDLGLPLFVKPANMGSSVGIGKAHTLDEVNSCIVAALAYDEWLVVEEAIVGREIEVAVLGNLSPQASIPGEIRPSHEFYDYEDKYLGDGAELIIPAHLTAGQTDLVRALAIRVFTAVRAEGMARVDFFFEAGGRGFLCNEINTIPGFTPISMFPKLWQASGVEYRELIDRLVELAIERHGRRRRNTSRV
jgi:D-alanine--D-alanine ligase